MNYIVRPGSNFLFTTNPAGNAIFLNVQTSAIAHGLSRTIPPILSIVELLDGFSAFAIDDSTIHVWNYEIKSEAGVLVVGDGSSHLFQQMTLLNRKNYLAAGDSLGMVCFWNVFADRLTNTLLTNQWIACKQVHAVNVAITAMLSLPSGRLATGAADGSIKVSNIDSALDNGSDIVLFTLTGHTAQIVSLRYVDNNKMVSAAANGEINWWEVSASGSLVSSITTQLGNTINMLDIVPSPGGASLMVCLSDRVLHLDGVSGSTIFSLTETTSPTALAVLYTPGISILEYLI
jgi:WD40 repeat protein